MNTKMRMEIKAITPEGTFEGILSPYGNVDDGGDVVEVGAFTKTIKERGSEIPLLWQHKRDEPIGMLTLEDSTDGLKVKGALLMELPEAQKAYLLIKARIVKGLSIGFKSVKDAVQNGIRHLKEIKLYEGSIVTFPMNELALITSVKSGKEDKGDFIEELRKIELSDLAYQLRSALSAALNSLFWSGMTREEMLSLAETIIDQFREAYLTYLPAYIDMLTEYYGEVETWSAKHHEVKAGASISAANKASIKTACEMIQGGHDILFALSEDKAGAATLLTKAATVEKPEPVENKEDHSAEQALLDEIRAVFN